MRIAAATSLTACSISGTANFALPEINCFSMAVPSPAKALTCCALSAYNLAAEPGSEIPPLAARIAKPSAMSSFLVLRILSANALLLFAMSFCRFTAASESSFCFLVSSSNLSLTSRALGASFFSAAYLCKPLTRNLEKGS